MTGLAPGPRSPSPTRWSTRRSETIWVRPGTVGCTGPRPRWSPPAAALAHRVAAAVGPDESLADDLEEAARRAAGAGEVAQGAAWLAQASAASVDRGRAGAPPARCPGGAGGQRRCRLAPWPCGLRSRSSGPARGAARCWATSICSAPGGRSWRRTCWRPGRPTTLTSNRWWEPARPRRSASYLCTVRRLEEALAWGERAIAASAGDPAARLQALVVVALSLTLAGRGPEGLARLGELPAAAAEGAAGGYRRTGRAGDVPAVHR